MKFGTFSPEIKAVTAAELFRKAKDYGFSQMQFDYASLTTEEMPEFIPDSLNSEIAAHAAHYGIEITAVNGTFNMAHPDAGKRNEGIARFEKIAASCAALGCKLVTLCTGTRNRESMWAPHPDNNTPEVWKDMARVLDQLILIAEKYDVNLGIETEASNVINTAARAKRLIEEVQSPQLKIILDAANLFSMGMAKREKVRSVISEGIELLAPWIVMAHGKDIKEGEGLVFTGPGQGIIDFDFFMGELHKIGYKDGMILHGIKDEKNIPACVDYIRKIAAKISTATRHHPLIDDEDYS